MGDTDIRAARDRIETVEKRIAAMQDAGVDTAALRAQLAFAHHALREGRLADIEAICDEVLGAARRLAELGSRASQVRTPAHGTAVQANRDPSTEEIRKVKIGRAQLAEEVRAAIDAEVKAQFTPSASAQAPAIDLNPLEKRLAALEARLGEVVVHAADAAAVAGKLQAIGTRLEDLEQRPAAAIDQAAIAAIVTRTVEEAVPRQASELLREAIAKLPTRDDLHQIAETLRADLDWRLEKAAAEHGWCSLVDVQSSVRKAMAEQDPGMLAGGSQLGRLEIALAEFVQQSKEQQERLIAALADKVVQRTQSLTKRMLVRDPETKPDKAEKPQKTQKRDTEELSPSLSVPTGEGSSRMAAITGVQRAVPATAATEASLDPVPAETIDATRKTHGSTTLFTKRVPSKVEAPDDVATAESTPVADAGPALHDLVTAEVERALRGAAASTLGESMLAVDSSPVQAAGPGPAAATVAAGGDRDLAVLVAAEVGRQLAMTVPVHLPPADSDLARAVARVLPQALQDDAVRTELFAVLALEAAGTPGVLGELTGLRRYLKRELQATASQLGNQVPAPV
jgi:hypothetical protein